MNESNKQRFFKGLMVLSSLALLYFSVIIFNNHIPNVINNFASTYVPTDSNGTDFESFSLGSVNSQDGWSRQGGSYNYDVAVVSNTYGYSSLGTQSLRISNAITNGSFNDHTFSKSLVDEAGETSAGTSTFSGGIRQPYFEAQWDFASTIPGSAQPNLSVVASPNRGDTMRMSWLQMLDTPDASTGLTLNFEDYQHSILNFVTTPIATHIDRTIPHTIKITVQFVDGAENDIVKIYLDGVLIHTGTTWEDYYRDQTSHEPYAVDSIMFRLAGTAVPANLGNGFLIDNFSSLSGPVPVPDAPVARVVRRRPPPAPPISEGRGGNAEPELSFPEDIKVSNQNEIATTTMPEIVPATTTENTNVVIESVPEISANNAVAPKVKFLTNISTGKILNDVKSLQEFLNNNGYLIAKSGPGSLGEETSYFGPLTKAALIRFQEDNRDSILKPLGLTKGTGYFGVSTRDYINSLLK